jgi:hypothetical protein
VAHRLFCCIDACREYTGSQVIGSGGSIILLHFNPYDTTRLDDILEGILAKKLTMELLSDQGF